MPDTPFMMPAFTINPTLGNIGDPTSFKRYLLRLPQNQTFGLYYDGLQTSFRVTVLNNSAFPNELLERGNNGAGPYMMVFTSGIQLGQGSQPIEVIFEQSRGDQINTYGYLVDVTVEAGLQAPVMIDEQTGANIPAHMESWNG